MPSCFFQAEVRWPYGHRGLAFMLIFLMGLACSGSPVVAQAVAQPAGASAPAGDKAALNSDVFVIYRNQRGEAVCRKATPEEKRRLSIRDQAGPTRTIYSGNRRAPSKGSGEVMELQTTQTGTALLPSAGLHIVLHATEQLQNNPMARDAFIVAANRWEALISTPITVVLDVDFGTTIFGQPFSDPNVLGATRSATQTWPLSTVRQRLIDNAPEADELQLYNSLPATDVPVELNPPGTPTSTSNVRMTVTVARALGLQPNITDPNSVPLGQGDAGMGFNSARQFDFNPDNGIDTGTLDFDAVVVHEIGHALGFTSNSGNGSASPVTIWDLFRFRPGTASLGTMASAPRVMSEGTSTTDPQVFFNNRVNSFGTTELQLSTGGSDGQGGDGAQSSHWKDDSFTPFIGIMDPRLPSGHREVTTVNDLNALDTFGYKIGGTAPPPPPPPPAPPNDNFVNAEVLSGSAGVVSGTNHNATPQAGEPNPGNVTGGTGGSSVWYRWTAPASGQVTFDTIGSDFDTTLGVYTGTAVGALTRACPTCESDDIVLGENFQSRVQFSAVAGTTYQILVDGWGHDDEGSIRLNWVLPTLLTEEGTNRAVALDSVTQVRGPFSRVGLFNFSLDRRTRVMLFTSNLGLNPGDDLSVLSVQMQGISVPVEKVGTVPGLSQASYIIVRLTDTLDALPAGDWSVSVTVRGVTSNAGTIGISP
jgi:hypothetical protein